MKKIISLLFLLITTVVVVGCGERFSNEEHVERISERVRVNFFEPESDYYGMYTDFEVRIIYDLRGRANMFMVEFMPDGFFYGLIYRDNYYVCNFYWGSFPLEYPLRFWGHSGWLFDSSGCCEEVEPIFISHFRKIGIIDNERLYASFSSKMFTIRPVIHVNDEWVSIECGRIFIARGNIRAPGLSSRL